MKTEHAADKTPGEWTVRVGIEHGYDIYDSSDHWIFADLRKEKCNRIADAHNAALAAEREKVTQLGDTLEATALELGHSRREVSQLRERLADGGGHRDEWFKALTTITKLERQLAAAQALIEKCKNTFDRIDELAKVGEK